ncbi:MAG: RNA methyltransferase [Ruminococcaceae bacterium]|nr:RNA methyltransferase [Oscillospiraceae bacterium]
MIKEDIKFQDSNVFEGMTSIRAIIKGGELGVNDRKIKKILFDKDKKRKNAKEIGYFRAVCENMHFDLLETTAEEIEKFTLGTSHGGIIAITEKRTIPSLISPEQIINGKFWCMIQGIEDPYNFGYSIRSLYACGCSGIILPERNWLSAAGVVARSSAGASELLPAFTAEPMSAAKIFKDAGFKVVSADEDTDNILGKCEMSLPLLLIVGGEKRGISKSLRDTADLIVKIDYAREFRASLSAASASTMFAYEIMRQNSK